MSGPDMQQLMAQAQKMQAQLQEAQQQIAQSEVQGQAGGGLVTVTMQGTGEITDVTIDPKVVDPEDVETLQDLVLGALQDATAKTSQKAEELMGPLSSDFGALGQGASGLGF